MTGLRITRLSVPKAVENGSAVHLSCFFELEGETLYSVRWYRDYVEFYRFLPSNAPHAAQPVKLKGAYVDVSTNHPLYSPFLFLVCVCVSLDR